VLPIAAITKQRAAERTAESARLHLHLGYAYAGDGAWMEACAQFEQVLATEAAPPSVKAEALVQQTNGGIEPFTH
jgi:uncharacterized protein HemY